MDLDKFEHLVRQEREVQDKRFGVQDHDPFMYYVILAEEVGEVAKAIIDAYDFNEKSYDIEKLKHVKVELIQSAAVAKAVFERVERMLWVTKDE